MTDFLDQKRKEITDRLAKLGPVVEEYGRLQAAAAALATLDGSPERSTDVSTPAPARRRGRPRGSVNRSSEATVSVAAPVKARGKGRGRPKGRGGRPKGSGTRAAETLAAVKAQPGITIGELAGKLGIKSNYLYRVLPALQKEGKVTKKGRGWHAAAI